MRRTSPNGNDGMLCYDYRLSADLLAQAEHAPNMLYAVLARVHTDLARSIESPGAEP